MSLSKLNGKELVDDYYRKTVVEDLNELIFDIFESEKLESNIERRKMYKIIHETSKKVFKL